MSATASPPTGLMLAFVEGLYEATKAATNEHGEVCEDFSVICEAAYVASGFKLPLDTVVKKFIGSDAEIYYKEIREVRSRNLLVITTQDVTNADKIINELQSNFVTSDIINLQSDDRFTVLNQFQIPKYTVDGLVFKSMLDKVIIDTKEKCIDIYDLKCVWSVEGFHSDYYLYRRAYIQGFLYQQAMLSLTISKESPWHGFTVRCPAFIVCDSINYYNPLIYQMSPASILEAYEGFTYNHKQYPGVKSIIKDLKWAKANDVWNISRENCINNGIINI